MAEPFAIEVYKTEQAIIDPASMALLPALPRVTQEEARFSDLASDPPIRLTPREEDFWRRAGVQDRSAHLYMLAAILKKHGLRDDLIIQAIARHPLSIDKYFGRTVREAERIVAKLQLQSVGGGIIEGEVVEQMLAWNWLDFMSQSTRLDWLVEQSWMRSSVGFISGHAKSYKSWLALDLALSVVTGAPFIDRFRVRHTGGVLLIQEEDPHAVIQERLRLILEHKGDVLENRARASGGVIAFSNLPIGIINLQQFNLESAVKVEQARRLIRNLEPSLVILDPFINIITPETDEYRGSEIATALQGFKMWREEFGCAVLIVHHWNKQRDNERGGESMYGSFAFHAWMESALHVRPRVEEGEEVTTVDVEREFKAGSTSGNTFRVNFDIETEHPGSAHYRPLFSEQPRALKEGLLELIQRNDGADSQELAQMSGLTAKQVRDEVNKLLKGGVIDGTPQGGNKRVKYTARSSSHPD